MDCFILSAALQIPLLAAFLEPSAHRPNVSPVMFLSGYHAWCYGGCYDGHFMVIIYGCYILFLLLCDYYIMVI